MKLLRKNWIVLSFLCLLVACGPYIWFKVPQPEGSENLAFFPENLLGSYSSAYDTSILKIEPKKILKTYHEKISMSKQEFREEMGDSISEDTSFIFSDNWEITIKARGDSIKISSKRDEKLFHLSENQLLRQYKEYYFLNLKDSNQYWSVKILKLEGDTLEFDHILTEDDLRLIKKITSVEVTTDSIHDEKEYFLQPSKRELKKILKRRSQGEKFVKLNL